jgi:hypothetical protein
MPPRQASVPAYAGISLQPERMFAVVVQGESVLPVGSVAAWPGDVGDLLRAVVAVSGPGLLKAITVDVSRLLLESVLRPRSEMPRVTVIRIVPRMASDPALARSPADLIEQLVTERFTVAGGHDLLGNELCPLDHTALARVCDRLQLDGTTHVAVVAAGSQAQQQHERAVADAIQAVLPDARISAASDFGGQGLVAREATVVLNCALDALVGGIVDRWRRALADFAPRTALRIARGDGGYSTAVHIGTWPVLALGADDALQLCGAAHLARTADCRVVLPRRGGMVAGDVRHGLAVVRPGALAGIGTELVVPTAVLAPDLGLPYDCGDHQVGDMPVVQAYRDVAELACIGAAVSKPTAWLDEVDFIESEVELHRVRRDAQWRATAIVMANGAAPGSAYLAEASIVAVPYSPSGMVRVRVRVVGAPDTEAASPAESARTAW